MISIVVPMFNEEEGVTLLHERLSRCAASWGEEYEFVFVNDGSRDRTFDLLEELHRKDPHVRVIGFTRNFGHQAAVTAGLRYARGDLVAVIDADLQDPPEELSKFFKKCREGFDVVYAIRTKRKESLVKRGSYWLFYRILGALANIKIPLDSGDFCVMRREVVDALNLLPERNRFIRGLRVWVGYRHTGLAYERAAREFGETKYTLAKLINFAFDGIVNFSFKPLRVLMFTGFFIGAFAFLLALFVMFQYVTNTRVLGYNPHDAKGWTSLILVILFLSGTQLFGMGVLGEYLGRIFEEMKGRPPYLIRKQLGFESDERKYPGDGK